MEKEKILEIANDVKNKSNKDLFTAVNELNDEFDEQTPDYIKVNNFTYIYEGKTLIVDFLRETGLSVSLFDSLEIESDTLAGLITEFKGLIPKKGENITIENVQFVVEAADPRKVKKIRVILPQ